MCLCSERERARGDREVWGLVGENTIGVTQQVGIRVRYAYDRVFDPSASNTEVRRPCSLRPTPG